jgi:hypothetical protein
VDLLVRDHATDWGNTEQPTKDHARSVDIRVDAGGAQPFTSFTAIADKAPSLKAGDQNLVYVRVRNRGPDPAADVRVKLHWAWLAAGSPDPDLPADFWTAFASQYADAGSATWHSAACAAPATALPATVCAVAAVPYSGPSVITATDDAAAVVAFRLDAPPAGPMTGRLCLLALVDSPQDSLVAPGQPQPPRSIDALASTSNNVAHRHFENVGTQ